MSNAALILLRAHLDQVRQSGKTTVPLTAAARQVLPVLGRRAPVNLRAGLAPAVVAEPSVPERPLPVREQVARPSVAPTPAPAPRERPASEWSQPSAAPAFRPAAERSILEVPGATVAEKLANLAAMAEADPAPRALGSLRETMVFAVGSAEAQLMFVGEAPGAEEERQREPFVGPAGQLLTKIIENAMGLQRAGVYISNICKFRPGMGEGQGSRNRQPTPEEMNACLPYIQTEIRLIRPQVIVALGATAASGLGLPGAVGRLRSRFHEVDGIPTMVTYHPSYILRQEQEGGGMVARRQVWEDMLMVMEKIGLPISVKQRGYFKPKG